MAVPSIGMDRAMIFTAIRQTIRKHPFLVTVKYLKACAD
jgi:hypothetical protein